MSDRDMSTGMQRRRFLVIVAAGAAGVGLGALAACGPSAPPTSAPSTGGPTQPAPKPTTVPAAAPTVAAAAPTAPAPASTSAPAQATPGSTFRMGRASDVLTLDPHAYQLNNDLMITNLIFDTLIGYDLKLGLVPRAAESWQQIDPNSLRFNLRDGLKFSDGTPLNAEAVKFNYLRARDIPKSKILYGVIDSIETPDARTVIFKTKSPFGPLARNLAYPAGGLMSPDSIQKYGQDVASHPVGTGPWKLAEYVPKERISLVPNEGYWGPRPKVSQLQIRYIKEEGTRYDALLAGELDLAADPPPSKVKDIRSDAKYQLITVPDPRLMYIGFNFTDAAQTLPLRQAVGYAINRKEIIDLLMEGLGEPVNSFIWPLVADVKPQGKWPEYEPERARQLVAQAGAPTGLTLSTPQGNYPKDKDVAEVVTQYLKAIGLNVELKVFEPASLFNNTLPKHEQRLYLGGWGFVTGDADQGLRSFAGSASPVNYQAYNNPKVDQWIDQGAATPDQSERNKAYTQVEDALIADQVLAPMFRIVNGYAATKNVMGFNPLPLALIDISALSLG